MVMLINSYPNLSPLCQIQPQPTGQFYCRPTNIASNKTIMWSVFLYIPLINSV